MTEINKREPLKEVELKVRMETIGLPQETWDLIDLMAKAPYITQADLLREQMLGSLISHGICKFFNTEEANKIAKKLGMKTEWVTTDVNTKFKLTI